MTLLGAPHGALAKEARSAAGTHPAERPQVSHRIYRSPAHDPYAYGPHLSHPEYWNQPSLGPGWFFPDPGRTSFWLAAGSHDYLGAGLTTRLIDPTTGLMFSFAASREQGETWWGDYDYNRSRVAPTVSWSNRNTAVWLGFEHARTTFAREANEPRSRPLLRERRDSGSAAERERWRAAKDLTRNSMHAGIHHRLNTFLGLSAGVTFSDASGHSTVESIASER